MKLAIEIDGITHNESATIENDKPKKPAYFHSLGNTLIRFTDEEVVGNSNLVEEKIRTFNKILRKKI